MVVQEQVQFELAQVPQQDFQELIQELLVVPKQFFHLLLSNPYILARLDCKSNLWHKWRGGKKTQHFANLIKTEEIKTIVENV